MLKLFVQLCQKYVIVSLADITLLSIDDATLQLIRSYSHDKIELMISFYGVTLYHEGVKRLYREKDIRNTSLESMNLVSRVLKK